MSEDKKLDIPKDPVSAYKKGIAERAAKMREARRKQRQPMPNLAEADASYDPKKGQATLGALGNAQQQIHERAQTNEPGLSQSTIAGLQSLKEEMDKQRAGLEPKQPAPPAEETPTEEPEQEADITGARSEQEDKQSVPDALRAMDDLEFSRIASSIQQDVINNDDEKKAIERRLEKDGNKISLEDGLGTGTFRQAVPITDHLTVHYRSVSPNENRAIRLLLWNWIDKDPRLENLASDLYGLMLIVAAVEQIGTNRLPEHMKGNNFYEAELDEDAFKQKFNLLDRYPGPLIHAIGVHANWFDERVRKLFVRGTLETLKNG